MMCPSVSYRGDAIQLAQPGRERHPRYLALVRPRRLQGIK